MKTAKTLIYAAILLLPSMSMAQDKYGTRNGEISFFSSTPMEDISAINTKVASVFVPTTGTIEFSALIKAFEFEKALMQEHFNENYMESSTFPKATFKGKLVPAEGDDLSKTGIHAVNVEGMLTIHGVEKPMKAKGTVEVGADGTVKAMCDFDIKPEDHGITIPGVVRAKIAQTITAKVRVTLSKL
ncbi:MAG: YceI family protein [Flavobacteriales bacterium]|nr:YceI family protein [Flavobacteriales bacterium]